MSIIAKANGGDFESPTTGMHQAVCSNIYGPFKSTYEWQGKSVTSDKVTFLFELDQLGTKGEFAGKRLLRSIDFTLSLHEKAKMRPFIESWAGKPFTDEQTQGFDIEILIGANCNLNLIEKPRKGGGMSVVIATIVPRMKGQEVMVPELPRTYMPEWMAKKLSLAPSESSGHTSVDGFEDDIPF